MRALPRPSFDFVFVCVCACVYLLCVSFVCIFCVYLLCVSLSYLVCVLCRCLVCASCVFFMSVVWLSASISFLYSFSGSFVMDGFSGRPHVASSVLKWIKHSIKRSVAIFLF